MHREHELNHLQSRVYSLQNRAEITSRNRFFLFVLSAAWTLAVQFLGFPQAWFAPAVVGFAGFAFLVWRHDRLSQALELFRKRLALAQRTRASRDLDWPNIPALPPAPRREFPRYFSDLDLLHGFSLLRVINHTVSTRGYSRLLAAFENHETDAEVLRARQKSTQALGRLRVLRRRFLVTESLWSGHIESDRIEELLAHPLHSAKAPLYFVLVASVQAAFLGLFAWSALVGGTPWFLLAGVALMVTYRFAAREVRLLEAYAYGMSVDVSLGKFSALARVAERISRAAPDLGGLLHSFGAERNPRRVLARTGRVVGFLGARQNYILHLALNFAVPWDFFWTLRLERLRKEIQGRMPEWLNALAELEVFISLAEFHRNHPDYVFPQLTSDKQTVFTAEDLGHPLIHRDTRVGNSLRLSDDPRCVLITGSNMSGKSTFLRSIGVNILLARAGTVVCAKSLTLGAVELATSLRLNDSLEEGLSSFYAEVKQLKRILDRARAGHPVLYLIDEVFRGTNNKERLIGSRAYLRHIAATQSHGLVTTHDLELAQLEGHVPGIRNFHFRETIEGDQMVFTYKLAAGPCPSTNAVRVMQLAGLPVE